MGLFFSISKWNNHCDNSFGMLACWGGGGGGGGGGETISASVFFMSVVEFCDKPGYVFVARALCETSADAVVILLEIPYNV